MFLGIAAALPRPPRRRQGKLHSGNLRTWEKGEAGAAPRHAQPGHLGQHVEQFLRHAVAEIFVGLVRAHAHEWQHGDGFLVGGGRRAQCH